MWSVAGAALMSAYSLVQVLLLDQEMVFSPLRVPEQQPGTSLKSMLTTFPFSVPLLIVSLFWIVMLSSIPPF
ncbi:MAG TPA: hypothetical protein VGF45_24320 [Polyangia bacterium]